MSIANNRIRMREVSQTIAGKLDFRTECGGEQTKKIWTTVLNEIFTIDGSRINESDIDVNAIETLWKNLLNGTDQNKYKKGPDGRTMEGIYSTDYLLQKMHDTVYELKPKK